MTEPFPYPERERAIESPRPPYIDAFDTYFKDWRAHNRYISGLNTEVALAKNQISYFGTEVALVHSWIERLNTTQNVSQSLDTLARLIGLPIEQFGVRKTIGENISQFVGVKADMVDEIQDRLTQHLERMNRKKSVYTLLLAQRRHMVMEAQREESRYKDRLVQEFGENFATLDAAIKILTHPTTGIPCYRGVDLRVYEPKPVRYSGRTVDLYRGDSRKNPSEFTARSLRKLPLNPEMLAYIREYIIGIAGGVNFPAIKKMHTNNRLTGRADPVVSFTVSRQIAEEFGKVGSVRNVTVPEEWTLNISAYGRDQYLNELDWDAGKGVAPKVHDLVRNEGGGQWDGSQDEVYIWGGVSL